MPPIKVLIVDDSALIRQLLKEMLSSDPGIEVVGTAHDPLFAMQKMARLNPDVITLDVEMPRMNGMEFLKTVLAEKSIPVIMVSSYTRANCDITMSCLEAGAVDFVTKPSASADLELLSDEIIAKVRTAAKAKIRKIKRQPGIAPLVSGLKAEKKYDTEAVPKRPGIAPLVSGMKVEEKHDAGAILERKRYHPYGNELPIIAIGASTGGVTALHDVLHLLPSGLPGIVVAQHMPGGFTKAFAGRMNNTCLVSIKEAQTGDRVVSSSVLIAPGGYHLIVQRDSSGYYVEISDGLAVNRHKPSVDVLFRSVANSAGKNALGIILTGMGNDGARGMLEMKEAGSYNVAQNKESCVVFGMPKCAIDNQSVDKVISLEKIAGFIVDYYEKLLS